jgi:myo-inositol-1(or 4)-monophosphatase
MDRRKLEEFLESGKEFCKSAGALVLKYYNKRMDPAWTGRTHFKTAADDASEMLFQSWAKKNYPKYGVWTEESGRKGKKSGKVLVYDAVDGTLGLWSGITDHFAVCLALCEDGEPVVGIINAVKRQELYWAAKGVGAFCNDRPIHVSGLAEINKVVMGVDSGKHNRAAHIPYMAKLFGPDGVNNVIATGCASVPMCLVASGTMHAYFATSLEPEDMAACVCLAREAGAKVTNHRMEEWKLQDPSILMANPSLHGLLANFLGLK